MPENLKPVTLTEFEARRSQGDKDFSYSYFSNISISGDMVGFDFTGSRFMSCDFAFADISDAKFVAAIVNADFHSSVAARADFSQGILYWGRVNSCDFTHVNFCDASLRHLVFEESDLSHADFTGTTLDGSRFIRLSGVEAIMGMDKMRITMGGATSAEVENMKRQITKALIPNCPTPISTLLTDAKHEADRRAAEQRDHELTPRDRGRDQFIPR